MPYHAIPQATPYHASPCPTMPRDALPCLTVPYRDLAVSARLSWARQGSAGLGKARLGLARRLGKGCGRGAHSPRRPPRPPPFLAQTASAGSGHGSGAAFFGLSGAAFKAGGRGRSNLTFVEAKHAGGRGRSNQTGRETCSPVAQANIFQALPPLPPPAQKGPAAHYPTYTFAFACAGKAAEGAGTAAEGAAAAGTAAEGGN